MRILIVDDHPVTRDGLRSALSISEEVDIVGEASSGEEAIEVCIELLSIERAHGRRTRGRGVGLGVRKSERYAIETLRGA